MARWAGAKTTRYPSGEHTFRRVVIGGRKRTGENLTVREVGVPYAGTFPNPAKTSSGRFPILEYTLRLPMKEPSMAAWAAADQRARTLTYHPEQQFTSDTLFEVPPDWIHGQESARGPWPGVERLPLGAFRPASVPFVWVLGGCADLSREQAARLLRPLALIDLGTRIGRAAAEEARG
ncbi:MAG TPA: hypothetical protein EYP14_01440, partial [Planctomycetaceae bacterium]|nr:hypothetical protein [Planctomycetaceae bacterium]